MFEMGYIMLKYLPGIDISRLCNYNLKLLQVTMVIRYYTKVKGAEL